MSRKALEGIRVLDLSRVLAGPFCTQILGDLGAEILKIERPGDGDDTRTWGPPYLKDADGNDTSESAYYLSCNRNKKSVTVDIKTTEGQALIKKLIGESDILIENFKVGGLEKYGLGYEQLKDDFPSLIYCAISGFGQTGPLSPEPGYDFLAQAMAGLMACTGEKDGQPMKVGVALSDIMTGYNAAIGILAALHHRNQTGGKISGEGQMIDVALTDCTLAAMTNLAQYFLTSGKPAPRQGNAHASIVPYRACEASDGHLIIAVGNDGQFKRFCDCIGKAEWAEDERFKTNSSRVTHRGILEPMIDKVISTKTVQEWEDILVAANVPCGPVNTMDKVFAMKQIQERGMEIQMEHPYSATPISLVGSPIKMSGTPVQYELTPPICGAHTDTVLKEVLDLDDQAIAELKKGNIIS